jgi:hypothetical protein
MERNIFEDATRVGLRFKSRIGIINTEDLWNLKLQDLDDIAKELRKELKDSEVESFITESSKETKLLELQFEVVKHIILKRLDEKRQAEEKVSKLEKKRQIMAILEEKQTSSLRDKSIEELQQELEQLA